MVSDFSPNFQLFIPNNFRESKKKTIFWILFFFNSKIQNDLLAIFVQFLRNKYREKNFTNGSQVETRLLAEEINLNKSFFKELQSPNFDSMRLSYQNFF